MPNSKIVADAMISRTSVRWFNGKGVPHQELLDLLLVGVSAPSGANSQNQRFILIEDKEEIIRIGKIRYSFPYPKKDKRKKYPAGIIGNAAALIVVCCDTTDHVCPNPREEHIWHRMWLQNTAASIQNILVLAAAKGIGSCWISATPDMDGTRLLSKKTWMDLLAKYGLEEKHEVHGIVMLGYTDKLDSNGFPVGESLHQGKPTQRKSLSHYVLSGLEERG